MVLILTHSQDYYNVDLVAEYLKNKGFKSLRVNTDDFPLKYQVASSFPNKNSKLFYKGETIDLREIKAVWLRKFWGPTIDAEIDEKYAKSCYRESLETIKGLFYTLNTAFWMDSLEKVEFAGNKMSQLQLASNIGLKIPETLITNKHEELKSFYNEHNKKVMVKMLTTLSVSMAGDSEFFYTSKLNDEHVEDSEMLALCPMTFQREIEKDYELRIIYVDGQFHTGKLVTKDKLADTRISKAGSYHWEKYKLPGDLERKLSIFMQQLGLYFGAIDVIKSTDNNYYFLEVNPTGEWGMLQKELNLPIAESIAELLIKRSLTN